MNEKVKTKRILVVDDEEVIQRLLGRVFARSPYDLVMAGSVEEGLTKLKESDFHLLVTDLRLPDGSGTSIIRHFKERFPSSQVIIITGSLTPEERMEEVADVSISGCLSKPFELEALRTAVMQTLGDVE